jgi:hypothetical protein
MSNIAFIVIIIFACSQTVLAQSAHQNTYNIFPSKYEAPNFVDVGRFIKDIKYKMMLKQIFNQQKRDTLIGLYVYGFEVNENGKVLASRNHNSKDFERLQHYVDSIFNNYRWIPAFKKDCTRCKLLSYVELNVFFNTEDKSPNVYIDIWMLHRPKQKKRVLFSYTIPFNELQ